MTLLKCFTLLMFESRLIKEEAPRGRIFTSHVKKRFAVTLVVLLHVSHEYCRAVLRLKSTYPIWSLPLRFPIKF
jgi:hypothetical protein